MERYASMGISNDAVAGIAVRNPVKRHRKKKARPPAIDAVEKLSENERAVFQLIGWCKTRPQIARIMNMAPTTVGTYRIRIKKKLGLTSQNQLLCAAIRGASDHSQ